MGWLSRCSPHRAVRRSHPDARGARLDTPLPSDRGRGGAARRGDGNPRWRSGGVGRPRPLRFRQAAAVAWRPGREAEFRCVGRDGLRSSIFRWPRSDEDGAFNSTTSARGAHRARSRKRDTPLGRRRRRRRAVAARRLRAWPGRNYRERPQQPVSQRPPWRLAEDQMHPERWLRDSRLVDGIIRGYRPAAARRAQRRRACLCRGSRYRI